jgi:hypothetical protein
MILKGKGQRCPVAKQEPLASTLDLGGLAERSNAADCKSVNGAQNTILVFESLTILGFESLTRRQISSPVKALTSTRE